MAVRYITTSDFPELTRDGCERDERRISGAEHNGLGAVRGFVFAMLIEAALVLLGGVGWELWRMVR
jgi:hypothetical protein